MDEKYQPRIWVVRLHRIQQNKPETKWNYLQGNKSLISRYGTNLPLNPINTVDTKGYNHAIGFVLFYSTQ
ncbi:hypothetical protein GCM10025859_53890 [Alicyclobacillus fastidiosus]|nr:hypothetical protein GCM10025859_53890 [Alicyclobacillus fastidiosus]